MGGGFLELKGYCFTDFGGEAVAEIGEGFVVEDSPDGTVVEGELAAGFHLVFAVTDVEEAEVREDTHVEGFFES